MSTQAHAPSRTVMRNVRSEPPVVLGNVDATLASSAGIIPVRFNIVRASLELMIAAAGFHRFDPDIVDPDFSILDGFNGTVDGALVPIGRDLTPKQAVVVLDRNYGMRGADNAEILGLAAGDDTGDLLEQYRIVGIGQRDEGRCLALDYCDVDRFRLLETHWGKMRSKTWCLAFPKLNC